MGERARRAGRTLAGAGGDAKNRALCEIADELERSSGVILKANELDLKAGRENGMSEALLDRLALDSGRIGGMADAVRQVALLPDPVGITLSQTVRDNGLVIKKISVPIGTIAVIYEARPNVTVDSAALCLKSGNSVILRGGSEAINSNMALADALRRAVGNAGLPVDCISLVADVSRESARELMTLNDYVDLLIPRGGAGLIKSVVRHATVPVIETGAGTCHVYVDADADLDMAADILFNAKTSRPSVCNACECVLVHSAVCERFLPLMRERFCECPCEFRADERALPLLGDAVPLTPDDLGREYNDYILAVKTVDSLDEAIEFISRYGTKHSECIVTENDAAAQRFLGEVDAAAVYRNASTRFTDGGEFGLGAEIGISTQKLHARGPLGLRELTTYKYIIEGNGQVR